MSSLYLLIVPAAALLALALWYALVVGWALVLGRMASSVSAWEELEEDNAGGRKMSFWATCRARAIVEKPLHL